MTFLYMVREAGCATCIRICYSVGYWQWGYDISINPLALELDIYSSAHHLCKM